MTDYTELQRLAEHHLSLGHAYTVATPAADLALNDENERIKARLCVCRDCGGQGEIYSGHSSYQGHNQPPEPDMDVCGTCGGDGVLGPLEDFESLAAERDQLKAENDALRAKRLERAARTKKLVDIASSHRRDAVALRKELESHKRMLLAAACDLGAIGEALGAEMDDDGSELEGMATQLRKDVERLQSATAFVQKLCDSAGKQPSVATGYLHDILSAMGKGEQS